MHIGVDLRSRLAIGVYLPETMCQQKDSSSHGSIQCDLISSVIHIYPEDERFRLWA